MRNVVNQALADTLKSLRDAANLTQGDASKGVVSQGYYAQIELGEVKSPNADFLVGIARNINADPNLLLEAAGYARLANPARELEYVDPEVLSFFSMFDRHSQRQIIRSLKTIVECAPTFMGSVMDESTNGHANAGGSV